MQAFGMYPPNRELRVTAGVLTLAAFFSFSPAILAAQVSADQSTATSVVVNADGSVTVGIAPTTPNGVSLNRYTEFNVPKPGVQLDNRTEAARTIVNEVTGTSRTDIEGPVKVLGQRAHVIVANPNGIVIDGGRFVNTGRVALTTGPISTTSRQIAPGIYQENVVSTVNDGFITVKGEGLSGQMDAIDLIAHSIQIDGPVHNSSTSAGASIRVAAGRSGTEFDSSVVPGNTGFNWGSITNAGATSEGAVLVELSSKGTLRAGRVGIEVSDKGAGVRFAGQGYATSRSFTLNADGQINLSNAKIDGAAGLVASGRSITLEHSVLTAPRGPVSLTAKNAAGKGITGLDSSLVGQSVFLNSEADLHFRGTTDGIAKLTASEGDVVLQAKGSATADGIGIVAKRNILVNAHHRLSFSGSALDAKKGSIQLDTKGAFEATGSLVNAFGHMLITADEATIRNGKQRTELKALNGSFILTTLGLNSEGHLTNLGGLVQGGTQTDGLKDSAQTASSGAVTLNVEGSLINTTADDLAIVFGAGGDVSIRTNRNVENNRGRILANGDVKLIAAGDVLNMVEAPNGTVDAEVVQYTRKGRRQWWTLWIKRKRESYVSYDYGTLLNADQLAVITAKGGVSIKAGGSLINQGGDINANEGDLEIKALRVETIGLGSGKIFVRRTCVLTCSYEGAGSVAYYGGRLNASEDVRIEATEKFHNRGGSVFAIGDVKIVTAEAELEAALVPTLVKRPRGLYNFWSSKAAWVFLRDHFGSIMADTGKVSVESKRPVRIKGGTMTGKRGVELENGKEIVRLPGSQSSAPDHTIGFFADLPIIRQ